LQVKFEGGGYLGIVSTDFNVQVLALLGEGSGEERVEDGVDFLTELLDHKNVSLRDGDFDLLGPALL